MTRPLHAVFTELLHDEAARQAYAADPAGLLEDAGHSGLSDELVAEAIISFADTASPAVAEHLAPFAMTHGPVPAEPGEATGPDGLTLLAGAPTGEDADGGEAAEMLDPAAGTDPAALPEPGAVVDDLGFGAGSEFVPTAIDAGGFDDALTAIPGVDIETAAPAPMEDESAFAADPALALDETEAAEDLDT